MCSPRPTANPASVPFSFPLPVGWRGYNSDHGAGRMATQRLRSEALPGTGGGLELIDWLEIRHDESDAIVESTRSALHYLRTLKQSIPTGPAPLVVTQAEEAEETEDSDALEGSQGITKRELLERQVHLTPSPTPYATLPLTATIAHCSTTRDKSARTCWRTRRTRRRRRRRACRPRALPWRVAAGAEEGVAAAVEREAGARAVLKPCGVEACPLRLGRTVGEGRHACCGSSCAPRTAAPTWALC